MPGKRDGCSGAGWLAMSSTVFCGKHVGRRKNASVGGCRTFGKVIERAVGSTILHSHRQGLIRYTSPSERDPGPLGYPFRDFNTFNMREQRRRCGLWTRYDRSGGTDRHARGGHSGPGGYKSSIRAPSPNNQSHPRSECLILVRRHGTRIVRIHYLLSKKTSEILT